MRNYWNHGIALPRYVVGAVSVGHFFSHFFILVYPPLFPLIRSKFGLQGTELGLVMSAAALGPLLFQVPVGNMVDRVGAKWVLVAGLSLTSIATALVGTASSYPFVVAFAVLAGFGQAVFHPADYALLEGVTDPDTRGRYYSVHTFGGYLGFAAAPVVIGWLGFNFGWRIALYIAGLTGFAYALFIAVTVAEVYHPEDRHLNSKVADDGSTGVLVQLSNSAFLGMFGFFLLTTMAVKGIQTFSPLFISNVYQLASTAGNIGLTVFFVCAAIGILIGGELVDRVSSNRIIPIALSIAALFIWAIAAGIIPGTGLAIVIIYAVIGLLAGITLPARDRLVSIFSENNKTGTSFGFVFTGLSLGGFVSPVLLGMVTDTAGLRPVFVMIGICYALAVVVVIVAVRTR